MNRPIGKTGIKYVKIMANYSKKKSSIHHFEDPSIQNSEDYEIFILYTYRMTRPIIIF